MTEMTAVAAPLPRQYKGPACPYCRGLLDTQRMTDGVTICPHCSKVFEAKVFQPPVILPRIQRVEEAGPGAALPCALHSGNAAVGDCTRCGTFMCGLCAVEVDDSSLCPSCFDRTTEQGWLRERYRDYGALAGTMAVAGLIFWFLSIIFGVFAVYFGIRAFGQRKELGEDRPYAGVVVAIVLGLIEVLGGTALMIFMFAELAS